MPNDGGALLYVPGELVKEGGGVRREKREGEVEMVVIQGDYYYYYYFYIYI